MALVTDATHSPAAPVGDRGEFLDVDMDQLAGPFALVTLHRCAVGRTVALVEAGAALIPQDALHRRGSDPGLVRDPVRAPTTLAPQAKDLAVDLAASAVR